MLIVKRSQFDGTVRMKATVSQAAGGGVKSVLLKVVDPLFKRDGVGAVLPITIRGTRSDPKVGLDFGRVAQTAMNRCSLSPCTGSECDPGVI